MDINSDNGSAVYSGVEIGTVFSGTIDDETLEGFMSDGMTQTGLSCCRAEDSGLEVVNDLVLDANDAALLNSVMGTNLAQGDRIDGIIIGVDAPTPEGGLLTLELAYVADSETFDSDSPANYPPDPNDVMVGLFFIHEEDEEENEIFDAWGVIDEGTHIGESRSVSGTVSSDGGARLEDVTVCVAHQSDPYNDWRCDVTDAAGFYRVSGLAAQDNYVVFVDHPGPNAYFRELHDDLPCCNLPDGTPVDLTAADAVIDFGLAPSGSLAGRLTDSQTGDPLAGIEMRLWVDCQRIDTAYTVSDDAGFYTMVSIPDGTYFLSAFGRPAGYITELYPDSKVFHPCANNFVGAQPIAIQNQSRFDGFDYALDRGAAIYGRISAPGNGDYPLNKLRARLYDASDGTQLTTVGASEVDGTYGLVGLLAGSYSVVLTGFDYNIHTGAEVGLVDERYDSIVCPRNSCPLALGQVFTLSGTQEISGVDAQLATGALIRGHLGDANTGEDVANFCVAVYTAQGRYAGYGCSDEAGNYVTRMGFPPGDYLLSNQFVINDPLEVRRDYIPQAWKIDGSFGNCGNPCDFLQGDVFTVTGLDPVEGIDLAMERGVELIGNVLALGQPLAGVDVALLDGASGQEITRVTTSDGSEFAFGDYLIQGLASGGYYLRTHNSQGFQDRLHGDPVDIDCSPDCDPFDGKLIEVEPDGGTIFIGFDLTPAASIGGRVLDPDSSPVAGVRVEVYNWIGFLVASGVSGASGDYLIEGLGGGQYFVRSRGAFGFANVLYQDLPCPVDCRVRAGTPLELADGQMLTGVDLPLQHAGSIGGTITGRGADGDVSELAGVAVELYGQAGTLADTAVTDLGGRYRFDGLTAGTYHLVTRNGGDYIDQGAGGALCSLNCDPLTTATVVVQPRQHEQVDLELFVSNSLFILVRHQNGLALAGITVAAFDAAGDEFTRGATDPSGRMELFGFPPGDYYLRTFNDQGFVEQVFDGLECTETCDPLQGTRTTLAEVDSASAEFTLSGGFKISGRVIEPSTAEGIGGVTMILRDINFVFPFRSVATAADGGYAFTGLTNDEYYLRTFGQHGYIDRVFGGGQCTPGRCRLSDGSSIDVSGADVAGIDLALEPGREIAGYAQDANGSAIREGWAVLFGENGEYLTEFASINEDGTFSLNGIADGTYFLVLRSLNSELVDTLYDGVPCPGYSCNISSGTPIVLGIANAFVNRKIDTTRPDRIRNFPNGVAVTITAENGHQLSGSMVTEDGEAVRDTRVYFFNEDGLPAGEAVTDGVGAFTSTAALPDGTYFAATSRAAIPEDEPEEANDAEDGVGQGLLDQAWDGIPCDGLCAPSAATGDGTSIIVSGGDIDGIDFVLERAPGVVIQTHTNEVDADTPNAGDAPEIAPGDAVDWTYTVTNTGSEPVTGIEVTDSGGAEVSCPGDNLSADASMECTASGVAEDLGAEPFTGVIGNCNGTPDSHLYQTTGTASGTSGGAPVMDADDSHYCNPLDNTITMNAGLNDAWFYPPTAGQGFLINVWEDTGLMFLAWFTYDKDRPPAEVDAELGEPGHRWLTAQGAFADNIAMLDITSTSGGEFDKGTAVENAPDGSLVVEFESCENGTVTYDIDSIGQQGVVPIQRIVPDNVAACEDRDGVAGVSQAERRPAAETQQAFGINWGMNDAWFNPDTAGQGFLISVFPEIELVFLAWFTYETERPDDGEAQLGEIGHRWITAQGPYAGNRAELDIFVSEGGRFDLATSPPSTSKGGTMVLEFEDCETGSVTYDIPSIGLQGEVPIERIVPDMVAICEELSAAPQ